MPDFQTIERIKRAHWLAKARRVAELAEGLSVMRTLMQACGWRV